MGTKIQRNEKCPCYSGKKYKKCCLNKKGTKLRDRSIESVYAEINELRNVSLKDLSQNKLAFLIRRLMRGYYSRVRKFELGVVHRSRRNKEHILFKNISELWYPPKECISQIGRVNDKEKPVFYCSFTDATAILESDPEVGDLVTVLKCTNLKADEMVSLMQLGLSRYAETFYPEFYEKEKEIASELKDILIDDVDLRKNYIIDHFLTEEFTKNVADNETYFYKITLEIAKVFLSAPNIEGFLYPSVGIGRRGVNFAIKPEIADQKFKPTSLFVAKIIEKKDGDIKHIKTHTSKNINSDGSISWGPFST